MYAEVGFTAFYLYICGLTPTLANVYNSADWPNFPRMSGGGLFSKKPRIY
jgi:hypothetical protein